MRSFARRSLLVLAAVGLLAACGKGGATGGGAAAADAGGKFAGPAYVLGNPNAKVTVAEYASVTCPHCARWEEEVWPAFKKQYVDTGQVRYEFREFLVHDQLDAAGYMLARCAGPQKYFPVVQAFFRSQPELFQTQDFHGVALKIAKSVGMSEAQFDTCLRDENALKQIGARQDEAQRKGVTGTPTFFVNDKKVAEQEAPLGQLDAAIQPLLK
jgi:protein-disulfide isomerase